MDGLKYYEAQKRQAVDAVIKILNGNPNDPITKKVRHVAGLDHGEEVNPMNDAKNRPTMARPAEIIDSE